jgi:hypothetical protein
MTVARPNGKGRDAMSTGYHGWTNRTTCDVAWQFTKDDALYRAKRQFVDDSPVVDGWTVEDFVRGLLPEGTPDMDGPGDYDKVDWDQIAKDWLDE